tara:strand:+ start:1114 stop:1380 length:267 start_codon:yes stop_codon:yes gene_type:complete
MARKNINKFVSVAEVVYYDPNQNVPEATRFEIEINFQESSTVSGFYLPDWLDEHKNQISKSIFKASQNISGESTFRFLRVRKVPYYST